MTFLVVLGCHRSGTSALTGLLSAVGFTPGKRLMPRNQFNERGYFEDALVGEHNEALLQNLGRSWKDERQLPPGWELSQAGLAGSAVLAGALLESFDLAAPCVLKDPRVCRLLPVMQQAFEQNSIAPKYIFSLRTPYAVVASLAHRDGIAHGRAALLYLAYLLEAERQTRGKPRVFVQYEALLADWPTTMGTIAQGLQVSALDPSALSEDAIARVDAFLAPELNHAPQAQEYLGSARPMQLAWALYECLCAPQDEQSQTFLNALYLEWQKYLESIEPWLSEAVAHERLKESLPTLLWQGGDKGTPFYQQSAASYLHWASAKVGHCGENAKRLTWQFKADNQHRYVLPALVEPITELRWDITESPAYCKVNRFWIENAMGRTVWTWGQDKALMVEPSPDLGLIGINADGALELISLGSDPYGVIQVPPTVLGQLQEGWAVCADWAAFVPTQGIKPVLAKLGHLFGSLGQTQQKLQSTLESLQALQRDSANESQALKELQGQRNQIRAEIIRAEAQIEMLKELIIGP
jgi:hypothetical protein